MKQIIRKALRTVGLQAVRRDFSQVNLYAAYSLDDIRRRKFINVGAGAFRHSFWTNIDYDSDHYRHLQSDFLNHDLMTLDSLPLGDDSIHLAYTSHTIEHITDIAAVKLFEEVFRSLVPGGAFRVTAPCADLAFRAYCDGDIEFFYWRHFKSNNTADISMKRWGVPALFVHHFATELVPNSGEIVNAVTYERLKSISSPEHIELITSLCTFNTNKPGHHINWWNAKKVCQMLTDIGFSNVYVSGYGQSRFAPMRDQGFFDSTHPAISFYVEAIK